MSIARAVAPASAALAVTAALLLMLSCAPVVAESPPAAQPGPAVTAVLRSSTSDAAVPADALQALKMRLVTAILIALSGSPASGGSHAVMWLQVRAGAGTGEIAERAAERDPAPTPVPQLMTASSSSD